MKKMIITFLFLIFLLSLVTCDQSSDLKKKDNTVTIYITRHGKTMLNTSERVQGWADSPLIEQGVEIAKNLGKGLKSIPFVAAYSSDSGRAIETAKLILEYNEKIVSKIEQNKRLRELNFGIFEGDKNNNMINAAVHITGVTSEDELLKLPLEKIIDSIAAADPTKQAEDWKGFSSRIKKEIDKISEETSKNGGGNVLIVSHGFTISSLVEIIDSNKTKVGLENASVTKILYKDGKYVVKSVDDMSYVDKGKNIVNK
ncbi:histidine phosphatase family protein [Bacillus anthracis]|nr:histidine phosphatase family protein [Bacillus thuringiensis]MCU5031435.1 histidine phosphatase family protein [Bacillus cereus]